MTPKILLTFDVEEFDIPEEYGQVIDWNTKIQIGTTGLEEVLKLIVPSHIPCTFFTTAKFAQAQPSLIQSLSSFHEIASHGYDHSHFEVTHLKLSKDILENITQQQINGYRMARLAPVNNSEIEKAGYQYNSSMNPTWIPGRYNNLNKPRHPYFVNNTLIIPTSVTTNFRIPLFWLTIKNFPMWWIKRELIYTLKKDGFLSLYFHPWEFTDTSGFGLPGYISKRNGPEMIKRLTELIILLKQHGEFVTMNAFAKIFTKP
ncbi:polysaccharide deacetylase [Bacteroidetes bacterium UKL13-3]|jgi:peptidoglycan/xylan/chitin deacetylase (PgdA/CDA1 family)|nr:polysaccharide deacetylase [Bacteroidetes bacterium UKL13-3]HCP93180.1 polysaccharide deacetylase [Bacteroidota bacterium]